MPGATYAFRATVTNPVVSETHDDLDDRHSERDKWGQH